ncbi:hypothetical protein CAPTEDRAFT_132588, partial [Capitella teleta]
RIIQTILFIFLMEYFDADSEMSETDAYLYASGIAFISVFQAFCSSSIVHYFMRCGLQWQASATGLIYRKALRASNSVLSDTTSGHVIDLVASDAEKLDWMIWELHSVWVGPMHAIIIFTIIYYQIGPSVFSSLAVMALTWPMQIVFANMIANYKKLIYVKQDERVTVVSDMISGMRVIKMYCWEKPFGHLVDKIRKSELAVLWSSRKWLSVMKEMHAFGGRLFTSIVIVVYVATSNELSAAKVFPMFALFSILSYHLMEELPWGLKHWKEVGVSCKRIQEFLLSDEIESSNTSCDDNERNKFAVSMQNVSASWHRVSPDIKTLDNVTFELQKGELLAVTGPVGSGKSSLLLALMFELPLLSGSMKIHGNFAYAGQQPWVFSSTIRQNILFGRDLEQDKYNKVLSVTALEQDLSKFAHHDLTIVGEKGVTLSGGQKARVALARTLYSDADVFLLDDPLSAVDAAVGRHIFNECIQGYLKEKTCVLVTHQLQYLKEVENICVMNNGKLELIKGFESLKQKKVELFTELSMEEKKVETEAEEKDLTIDDIMDDSLKVGILSDLIAKDITAEVQQEEDREVGSVNYKCFTDYFSSGNGCSFLILVFMLCLLTQASYNIADWWLSEWCDNSCNWENKENGTTTFTDGNNADDETYIYMAIYLAITMGTLIIGIFKTVSFYRMSIKSSTSLHSKMYNSVIRAPISFFDKNPKGRIINRFSGDMGQMDNYLPDNLLEFVKFFGYVIGNMIVMIVINPYLAIPLIPLGIALAFVRKTFIRAQSQCQRIVAAAHSPALTHLSATLEGIHTIRSSKNESLCIRDFDGHYDFFLGSWLTIIGVVSWFMFRIQFLAALFNVVACILCVTMADYLDAGEVGLSLSYVLTMLWYIEESTRLSAIIELDMVSAERVLRYTRLESEAPLKTDYSVKAGWPSSGAICFTGVNLSYKQNDEMVLKNLEFSVKAGEKIGIVGRTGAGKSSIIAALFRMTEFQGEIKYDGEPIKDMGLHDVRSHISIIPQDPTLFCGTIRSNLDPFEEHADITLWEALKKVQLESDIRRLPGELDTPVNEMGNNFSVGQRQLMCLARATLRKNHLLVLDEATANVDKETDEVIQVSIRKTFSECTVVTIAHRINTVIDLDRILVMDGGRLVEFDSPYLLLGNPSGALSRIVAATGEREQERLRNLAKKSYEGNLDQKNKPSNKQPSTDSEGVNSINGAYVNIGFSDDNDSISELTKL